MKSHKLPIVAVIALSLGIVSAIGTMQPMSAAATKARVRVSTAAPAATEESAIRAQLAALSKVLAAGDAKALAAMWTADGRYTDEDGNEAKGRPALETRFAEIFAQDGKPQVEFVSDSIRFLSNTVALSEGNVHRKGAEQATPVSHYSLLFVKDNGNWQISTASESVPVVDSNFEYLRPLSWLIGDWKTEQNGAVVRLKAEWVPSKNFIFCKYETQKGNEQVQVDTEIIGWDPLTKTPVSWHFDSTGGYGHGTWSKRGNAWVVSTAGVERDGTTTKALTVMNCADASNFTWQSTNRTVDGMAVADTTPLKVTRVVK